MRNDVRTNRGRPGGHRQPSAPRDHYAYHDPESPARLSTTLVHALADAMGVDTTDAGFVLHDSVDPDALDRIFSSDEGAPRPTGHVAFSVNGYRTTVYADGQIVITPPATPPR